MKKIIYTLLFINMVFSALNVSAQSIVIDFDKKVIYPDSLNLPRNTNAATLITLLPELLQRPGAYIVSNYDILIEDMSVGEASDVALQQLQIIDIEKIEVSESPIESYKNNGQGGVINFILRSKGNDNENLWGSAGATLSSPLDVAPKFNIGYKNDKFMIRSVVLAEHYAPTISTEILNYTDNQLNQQSNQSLEETFNTEMVTAFMQYNFTKRDIFKFSFSENYSYVEKLTTPEHLNTLSTKNNTSLFNIKSLLNYVHKFNSSVLEAEFQYGYKPKDLDIFYPQQCTYDYNIKSHNLSGKVMYKANLYKGTTISGLRKNLTLEAGTSFNGVMNKEEAGITYNYDNTESTFRLDPTLSTFYAMPYMTLEGIFGKFRLKTVAQYQYYSYKIDRNNAPYTIKSHDFTGTAIGEWFFTPNKELRLIFKRTLNRPSDSQLYPFRLYNPESQQYVEGNPYLTPEMTHEVSLDYIANYKWKEYQTLTFNVGVSFSKVSDLIRSKLIEPATEPGTLGLTQKFTSYSNTGSYNILSTNLMALYSYKAFSLSLTGNVYHKHIDVLEGDDHYTYFNISFYPHFNLKDGWHGGARLVYYSKVDMRDGLLGDCAIASMTVGKAWKRLFVYLMETMPLTNKSTDVTYNGNQRTEKIYHMVQNTATVGIRYSF